MEIPHCKLNLLNQKSCLSKQNETRKKVEDKLKEPLEQLKSLNMCGDSIKQLENLRIKKQKLERVGDAAREVNVWERLHKGTRTSSLSGRILSNPYRQEMCLKAKKLKNISSLYNSEQQPIKKILRYASEPKQSSKNRNHAVFLDSSLTEVYTARRFTKSQSSSDLMNLVKTVNQYSVKNKDLKIEASGDDSNESFASAMVLPTLSKDSSTCSSQIAHAFRSALENRQCFMAPDEISVVKDAIKSDKRVQVKGVNEKIFVEVLRSTLRKVSRQEHLLKLALNNLSCKRQKIFCSFENGEKQMIYPSNPQIHVIFKDIPQIEKNNIIINNIKNNITKSLRKYGNNNEITTRSACTITRNIQVIRKIYYVSGVQQYAVSRARMKGVCLHIAFVREFRIARKTITELKNDKRRFYLPVNDKHNELKRTSFKRLRENPQLLMSFMYPRDSIIPFNVLEQDEIFFNSFLYKSLSVASSSEDTSDDDERIVLCESNDINNYLTYPKSVEKYPLKIEEISSGDYQKVTCNENIGDVSTDVGKSQKTSIVKCDEIQEDLPIKTHNKKSIYIKRPGKCRQTTPLSEQKTISPKNRILPLIFVAVVEISIFLILIISHFYPDIAC